MNIRNSYVLFNVGKKSLLENTIVLSQLFFHFLKQVISIQKEMSSRFEELNRDCLPLCPLECNQTLYKTSSSFSQLIGYQFIFNIMNNSNLISDFINRTIDAATAEKSVVKVNVYYSSLGYTEITESPQMDIVSLLADIGGNLGLFLGVSAFSLAEILVVLIETFYIFKRK